MDAKADKPKMVMAIVDKLGRKGGGKEPGGDEGGDDDAKTAAGEEFATAVKSGDGAEIYRAFDALKELCEQGE